MSTKKSRQKLLKYRIGTSARIVACISFLVDLFLFLFKSVNIMQLGSTFYSRSVEMSSFLLINL